MLLRGLQKTTLLDFPGNVACTVFTGGCNFRCPFCHNASLIENLPSDERLSEENFFAFLEKRKGLTDGVCITGGEPLLQKDILPFIKRIKEMGFLVKLDTNGMHPDRLRAMLDEGLLDYVAMDVKGGPHHYAHICGLEKIDLAPINESISLLLNSKIDYEFRTTVVDELHDLSDFTAISEWIKGAKAYYLQAFTDRDTVVYENFHAPTRECMELYAAAVRKTVPNTALRGI